MPRQRFIWPNLWEDSSLGRLSDTERVLYICCFSIADDAGRLVGDPAHLRANAYAFKPRTSLLNVKKCRDNVSTACSQFYVYTFASKEYIQFLNWPEWQKPKYPKPSRLPPPPGYRLEGKRWIPEAFPEEQRNDGGAFPEDSSMGREGTTNVKTLDPTAAAEHQVKSTSSTLGSSYAGTNSNGHSAAAEESPPEHIVRAACQQFGSDFNVVEPLARQLTRAAFDALVIRMSAKVARGAADEPWALFTDLLQREIKAVRVAHTTIHIPNLDEQFAHEARGLALTTSPAEIIDEMLVKSLNRREIPERDRPRLLELAHSVIDQVRAAA